MKKQSGLDAEVAAAVDAAAVEAEGLVDDGTEEVADQIAIKELDPFDPDYLRLAPDVELVGTERVIVQVQTRKPGQQEFFRTHAAYFLDTAIIELKDEREIYLLPPALRQELGDEAKRVRLYLAMSRGGALFLWPVPLPDQDGRQNPWHDAAHKAAHLAMGNWVRMRADMGARTYEIVKASAAIPDPDWPKMAFKEILKIAFEGASIDSADHIVVRRLRGKA